MKKVKKFLSVLCAACMAITLLPSAMAADLPSEPEEMPQYEISNLPEGYQEIDRFTFSSYVSVIYQNEEGLPLYLDYNFIQQGGAHDFVTTNMDVSDIIVNGHAGQLFIAQDSNQGSAITWVDENQNLQFTIDGFADRESLLNMAESVRQLLK